MRVVTGVLIALLVLGSAGVLMAQKDDGKPFEPPIPGTRGNLDCRNEIPITCPFTGTGSTAGLTNNVTTYSCVAWSEGGGEVVYKLALQGPSCYTVTFSLTTISGDPDAFFLGSCDEANCLAYTDYSAKTTSCLFPGTYYIVVDAYGTTTPGAFTLNVTCATCTCPEIPCCPPAFYCTDKSYDFNTTPPPPFVIQPCGGASVWQWGVPTGIPTVACDGVPVTNVLATVLNGNYLASSGERVVIGPIDITSCCSCMELCHYYKIEGDYTAYDGANVKISLDGGTTWTLITPARGYDKTASASTPCVGGQLVFTGTAMTAFRRDCFNLAQYVGNQVLIGFFFGSDSSVQYPGWYIKWVKFGGSEPSATEPASWSSIKAMYK